jgi:hypothetical protein
MPRKEDPRIRWERYVNRYAGAGCWQWTATTDRKGYGKLSVDNRPVSAHRLSYQWFRGPIPEGMMVCHTCDNPGCVNPSHLFLGSAKDNTDDAVTKGRLVGNRRRGDSRGVVRAPSTESSWSSSAPRRQSPTTRAGSALI